MIDIQTVRDHMNNYEAPALQQIDATLGGNGTPKARGEILEWERRHAVKALRFWGGRSPSNDVDAMRSAVVERKLALGRAEVERKLARQVALSDRLVAWIARASGDRRRFCQVELFVPKAKASMLPTWYLDRADADDEAVFLLACPDHHLFRMTEDGRQEVWETTGGSPLASRFFFNLGDDAGVVTPADPTYTVQMVGAARLLDGTLIGGVRHQFRDESGGVRALLTVEYPWLMGPIAVAFHRWHVACEFTRWFEAACNDTPATTEA